MKMTKPCLFCGKEIIKKPNRSMKDWLNRTKFCSIECRIKAVSKIMIGNKYSLGFKQSKETIKKRSEAQKGCKGSNWRDDNIGYTGIHVWLKTTFGKPNKCENKDCVYPRKGAKKTLIKPCWFEWALIKGKEMKRRRENFIMLCLACHRKYDSGGDKDSISI